MNNTGKKLETDLIVIGAGGGGLPAAVIALEAGAKVIVLEKRKTTGGNASMARGIFACDTKVQTHAMIDAPGDEIFKNAVRWHRYDRINQRLLRAWIKETSKTIEWLESKGLNFEVSTTTRMHYHQTPCWHCVADNGRMAQATKALADSIPQLGGEILTGMEVTKILIDNGEVCGVLTSDRSGTNYEITAKAVVISTGGFIGNDDLMVKYFPYYDENFTGFKILTNKGDGISLALGAGAAIEDYCSLIREATGSYEKGRLCNEVVREPDLIWVNKKGRRFADEATGESLQSCSNAILMQPDRTAYAVFDDDYAQQIISNGFKISKGDDYRGKAVPNFREELNKIACEEDGSTWVKIADTLDELAQWIGCKPEALQKEIDTYNDYCTHGYDNDFLKERRYLKPLLKAPFYAVRHGILVVDTVGPLRVSENLELLDKAHDPIPGLYGAGVITSGWQSSDYCGDYIFGAALSYSLNSGRIAGRHAAAYIKEARKEWS